MNAWDDAVEWWSEVRAGLDVWGQEGRVLGQSLRDATFGAMRLASACLSWAGFMLTDLAVLAQQQLAKEKTNEANASTAAGSWQVRQ